MTLSVNKYNDEWIKENYLCCSSWKELMHMHEELFHTNVTYDGWKDHCTKKLKLHRKQFRYTEDMNNYLKELYPLIGKHVHDEFNNIFGTNISEHTLQTHCVCQLGLRVNEDRYKEIINIATSNVKKQVKANTKYKVGDISYGVLGGGGYVGIKTEDGWKQYHKYVYEKKYGEIPKGYVVTFLDGDKTNCNIENLCAIPIGFQSALNNMCKSGNKEIRKIAIKYLELNACLEKRKCGDDW